MSANFFSEKFWETASPEKVEEEFKNGADANAPNSSWFQETPLHVAAKHSNDPAAAELLLKHVTDINARDKDNKTPLHWAVDFPVDFNLKNFTPEIVSLLLDNGANIEAYDGYEQTPLHVAAGHSKTTEEVTLVVVKLLLERGANPNARGEGRRTPLHWAAANSETPAVVALLLDYVAKAKDDETPGYAHQRLKDFAKAKDMLGNTAFDLAKDNKALKGTDVYRRLKDLTLAP